MNLKRMIPTVIAVLVGFVIYDMFVKDMIKPKAFDNDL